MQIQKAYNSLKLSPKSVKNVHGVLRKALLQAKICSYLAQNVVLPRIEKAAIQPVNKSDIKLFMDYFKDSEYEVPMPEGFRADRP
ncbi:MAG: hypothetical protein FWG30_06065 [Eubacteriaceae bacterium]|jgi:integrase|nr:hypothetical protein [Eubacteriaceae bacterium]